jgi:hypothetical protein
VTPPAHPPRPASRAGAALLALVLLAGCASRSTEIRPAAADPSDFERWSCARIHDEIDTVQQRAVDVAWAVDQRYGQHVVALGVGLSVFWPALLAMRPDGAEAAELALLKGRYEALHEAARRKLCPQPPDVPTPERMAAMKVLPGEVLVYEERRGVRDPLATWVLKFTALRRNEAEFVLRSDAASGAWRQDLSGNVIEAPPGALQWQRLLKRPLALGDVLAGEIAVAGEAERRGRLRGQVVAVGPQRIAERVFDAAVIELYGDVSEGETSTRLEGTMAVDRAAGVLLRLDLDAAIARFTLQRRLMRIEPAS